MSSLVSGPSTILLSFGLRPVFAPDRVAMAPVEVSSPPSYASAIS